MHHLATDYRSPQGALAARWDRAREANAEQIDPALDLADLYGKSAGRIAGAVTAILLVIASFVSALVELGAHQVSSAPTLLLLLAFPAAAPAYLLTRGAAARAFRRELRGRLDGEPDRVAVEALEEGLLTLALRRLGDVRVLGLSLPLAAVALSGPLLLHFLVFLVAKSATFAPPRLKEFTFWIGASAMMVGVAHAALVVLSHDYVLQLVRGAPRRRWWVPTLGWTTLASMIPGVLALGIPVLLTLITGAVIIPLMFGWAREQNDFERQLVAGIKACADSPDWGSDAT